MKYTDRMNKLLNKKVISPEVRLSLEVGLEREREGLSMTPACIRNMALAELQEDTDECKQLAKVRKSTSKTLRAVK